MNILQGLTILIQMVSFTVAAELLKMLPSKEVHMKFVGDAFYVECVSESDNVQRIMWTGPDKNQITNYKDRIHVEDGASGHKGVDILFRNITKKDRGKYTCSANVDGKEVEVSFELVVSKPISFTDTPKDQYLEEGRDSTLICNVDGEPMPKVSWKAHGKSVRSKMGAGADKKFLRHPDNHNWIVVKNATLKDKGEYACNAIQLTQKTSDFETFYINVKVHHKPLPSEETVEQSYSYVTGIVNLTCASVAEPQANFTWLKDGVILTPSDDVQIFEDDHRSNLQLKIEDEDMFGDYYCKAQNKLGTLERVLTLEKGEKPHVPKTEVKEVKANGFRLRMRSKNNPKMPVIGYRVEYKKAGEEWNKAGIREFQADKPHILDGLQSDTLYVLRTSAKNLAGYSDFSKDLMQKTKISTPINKELSGVSRSQLSLTAIIVGTLGTLSYSLSSRYLLS